MERVREVIRVGIMHYANGDRYEGEWKKGIKEGKGTY